MAIRPYSIFINGKKAGHFNTNSLKVASGDEPQFNADGYEDHSDGATTSTLNSEAIIPVAGQSVRLLDHLLAKKPVDIGAGIVDGQILTTRMRVLECEYKSTTKDGALTGSFSFGGGAPKVTG